MKEIRKRSEELQQTILGSPALLQALSDKVAAVLGDRVELPDNTTYVFVPKVYSRPTFWPEVYATGSKLEVIPFGGAGPLDPEIAKIMDQERITYQAQQEPDPEPWKAGPDPTPWRSALRKAILRSPELFMQLSESMTAVLAEHGVTFARDETFAFVPVLVKKPVFAGDMVASPTLPLPPPRLAAHLAVHAEWLHHHLDEYEWEFDPGVIIDGIPAPEILVALEKMRL